MSYVQIVNIVFYVLFGITTLCMIHFLFFSIVGIFTHKKFPKAKVLHKYGLIIPARNEEAVVGNLIKSIKKNDYPQDKLHIFVIAHNCSDGTAKVCRDNGATVYEYNNSKELTKGYALKYLFECIERDYGIESYDGFICLDADNILSKNYIDKLNDAFDDGNCENVVTSFRDSKNFGANMISGLYGLFFINNCRLESRGRTVCGCSTRVQGTGFVISSKILKDGWPYVTLTEDWEFSADQVLRGNRIVYCDEAVFYDEQPTTVKVMLRQRLRWAKGHLQVCLTRCKALLKSVFSRKNKEGKNNSGSKYDIFINCLPICVITGLLSILNFVLLCIAPLIDRTLGIEYYWDLLIKIGIGAAFGYVTLMLNAVIIFILENKRIKNVNIFKRIGMTLLWPIFLFLSFPIEFVAMCSKNVVWKTIPHNDKNDFESLNDAASPQIEAVSPQTDETEVAEVASSQTEAAETTEAASSSQTEAAEITEAASSQTEAAETTEAASSSQTEAAETTEATKTEATEITEAASSQTKADCEDVALVLERTSDKKALSDKDDVSKNDCA